VKGSEPFVGWRKRSTQPGWSGVVTADTEAECRRRLVNVLAAEGGDGVALVLRRDAGSPASHDIRGLLYRRGRLLKQGYRFRRKEE
jgi:hypothetical protein